MLDRYRTNATRAQVAIVLICLGLIGLTWAVSIERVWYERAETVANAMRSNANLALAFEEHTVRTVKSVDQTVSFIKHEYDRNGLKLSIRRLIEDGTIDASLVYFVGITDERGDLILSSQESEPINVADREYFSVHQRNKDNKIFIGKPILGRITHKWALSMSRRIDKTDGSFAGVVFAGVKPEYFSSFYQKTDLGEQGAVTLVGLDGVTRARKTGQIGSIGVDLRGTTLFTEVAKRSAGSFVSLGRVDGVTRFTSYRTVREYPLIVAVGTSQDEVLASFRERRRGFYTGAGFASMVIVVFAASLMAAWSRQKRALDSLTESEARFRATFEQRAVGIAHTTLDGRLIIANTRVCEILGYTSAELSAMTLGDVIFPEDIDQSQRDRARLVKSEIREAVGEARYVRKDRSVGWVAYGLSLVRDPAGEPKYFITQILEITERKRVDEALRESEQRYREVLDSVDEVIYIIDVDPREPFRGVVRFMSSRTAQIVGCRPEEFLADRGLWFSLLHPDDIPILQERTAALYASAEPGLREYRVRHRATGDYHWMEDMVRPQRNADGKVISVFGVARDVTERKQAELAVIEQFKLAETFFNDSVSCFVILDRNFNFLRVNAAYAQVCHRDIGEFAGHNHFEMYPSDAKAIFEEVVRTKRSFETFTRAFTFADQPELGVTYWDWTLVPVLDEQGEVEYLVFSLNDVTERKRAEERALANENRLRLALSNVNMAVFHQDRALRYTWMYRPQLGYTQEQVIGRTDAELLPAEAARRVTELKQRVLQTGEIARAEVAVAVNEATFFYDLLAEPMRDATGAIVGLTGVTLDITERKLGEDALRESKERLERIHASVAEAIVSVDDQQRIVLFNPAAERMFGYTATEIVGQPLCVLFPERFRTQHAEDIRNFDATSQTGRAMGGYGQIYGLRASGEEFVIEASVSQSGSRPQKLFTAILRDITERVQADEALKQSLQRVQALSEQVMKVQQRERDALARELHDELGQSLTALKVNLQMLEPFCTDGEAEDYLTEALMIVGRSLDQVRNIMLDLRPPGLEALGLVAVLAAHVARQARAAGWRSHFEAAELSMRPQPALEMACFRVVQEALTNAMRHAHANEVWVMLGLKEGKLELSVRDDGKGFDLAAAYDGASSSTFGLIGMQERVRQLGGQLTIRSAIGRGTEIHARFPLDPAGSYEPRTRIS